jgi:hypothetical protein
MEAKYPCLAAEITVINEWLPSKSPLDALEYIRTYESEYLDTQVHREFRAFVTELNNLFEPE